MVKDYSIEISGRNIHVETGRIAKQANGSVVVTSGETVVLVTAVATDDVREGIDFLPLTVEYQEMSYAGGQIPGNFFRRDMGRPGEKETLISRLIDRPLRPLFPDNYHYETQVIATVLSTDKENEADMLAMLGASTALEISDIPFQGTHCRGESGKELTGNLWPIPNHHTAGGKRYQPHCGGKPRRHCDG